MANSLVGRILGNYKVIDHLGQGGMATVYIGFQESVDRKVAIKVLPPHPGLDEQFIERFQVEARTIARLQHPHILPLYDYGTTDDGILYLVMAYIEGGSLEDRVIDGQMPLPTVERFLRQLAGAMDYAHRQDVIHRDIKPGNILIDSEENVLLADFGIAKISDSNMTGTGVVGTPAYMAPEQAQGTGVDKRIDIYALGVVVYQMITGTQPYSAATPMQLLVKVIQDPVPNILTVQSDLPVALSQVMRRVLAKDPDDRYQTATAFAEAFTRAIHTRDESLANIQHTVPLTTEDNVSTQALDRPNVGSSTIAFDENTQNKIKAASSTDPQNQTIIVQQGTSPLLLLGGFAFIAIAMVLVVLLVLSNQNNNNDDDGLLTDNGREIVGTAIDNRLDNATSIAATTAAENESATQVALVALEDATPTFGRATFSSLNDLGDSISITFNELQPLATGQVYETWLMNTLTDEKLSLGRTVIDAVGGGSLAYTDADGRPLPALFNAVLISVEASGDDPAEPSDNIAYSGSVPEEVLTFLNETLFASEENGLNGGSLLDGARTEARTGATHAGLAARATNVGGMHTHAEHTINILRGEEEDYDGDGRGTNPGRGVGVYFFVEQMESLLNEALSAPNASRSLQVDGELVRICLVNTRLRGDRVTELEQEILAETEDITNVEPQATESTSVAEQLTTGIDLNENGRVDAFENECGLDQVETFSLLVASMDILEGAPADATE
ncbi:MAG: protein kinase [Aggregatilineales bacterium]